MRLLRLGILFVALAAGVSCGGGGNSTPQGGALSGNWQITLERHVNPDPPLVFTGFLRQTGNDVTGSLILGSGCSGVGPVTGTLDGQNISLSINEFGQALSLTGTSSSSTAMNGQFSNLAGGCTDFANTGTWSAIQIAPLSGDFHGIFTSALTGGIIDVNGTVNQGPNTGGSNATLTGTVTASGSGHFCSYLSTANINGVISGTTVALKLFGPDGSQIAQIGEIGQIGNPAVSLATVTPDGTSLSGSYIFSSISKSCPQDQGTLEISFP